MVDRDELRRRWAPTLGQPEEAGAPAIAPTPVPDPQSITWTWPSAWPTVTTSASASANGLFTVVHEKDRPSQGVQPHEAAPAESARAFVTDVNGKTLISGPAVASPLVTEAAARYAPTLEELAAKHMLRMQGRFVGADRPNRNGALWSAGDLEIAQATVMHGPLNWLHEERKVIGCLTNAKYTAPDRAQAADGLSDPYIEASAVVWRWIYPDEAFVIERASEASKLWYSMECIAESVECAGDGGCGSSSSYSDYLRGSACEHIRERSSVRRFVKPTFLGGAVIVPPVSPGWAEANASVLTEATTLAEAAYEQAGQPDMTTSEWERLMGEILRFARS